MAEVLTALTAQRDRTWRRAASEPPRPTVQWGFANKALVDRRPNPAQSAAADALIEPPRPASNIDRVAELDAARDLMGAPVASAVVDDLLGAALRLGHHPATTMAPASDRSPPWPGPA
jgi:hypothetical protein